jgi:hypothetical protein
MTMKFVHDLYNHYKDQLVGDEEDALIIVSGILEELNKEHLLAIIRDMSRHELYEMLGRYMVEQLRELMAREGIGRNDGVIPLDGDVH